MHDLRYNFGLNREELNAAAARVNNAIIFGTPEMVAEDMAGYQDSESIAFFELGIGGR